jgi:hypothetical protein
VSREAPIRVRAYAGSRGEEEPRAVEIEGRWRPIEEIERAWREPTARWFRVRLTDGGVILLRCDEVDLSWWRIS